MIPDFTKEIPVKPDYKFRYSICTLVTNKAEYGEMVSSFVAGGFDTNRCEYLFIDNSNGNKADAYAAYNTFLSGARGEYIILCHQDVVLLEDGIETLEKRIKELDLLDPSWAVLGNAGAAKWNHVVMRITHPKGEHKFGKFPIMVQSLDENFILAKNSANLCVSHDLSGFHLYGTDICQMAKLAGRSSWAVDFNLFHKSEGKLNKSFFELSDKMEAKHRKFRDGIYIGTTCTLLCFANKWVWFYKTIGKFLLNKRRFEIIYYAKRYKTSTEEEISGMMKEFGSFYYSIFWILRRVWRPFKLLIRSFAAKE